MKTFIRISILFIMISMSLTSQALAEDPLVAGKAAYEKGDYVTAISKFLDAVRKDKKNPEPYIWLGKAFYQADSLDQAVGPLVQARELDTANAQIYELLGDVYGKQRIWKAAMDQYRTALQFDPQNIGLLLKLLDVSKKARQYNDAVEAGTRVLAIDSNNVTALTETGSIYLRAKKYPNAVPIYKRLILLQPDNMSIKINYVKALDETRNCEELIPIAESIVEKDASQTEIQTILAKCYTITKQSAKVVEAFSKLKVDSLSVDNLLRYANALKAMDSIYKALEIYQKAFQKDSIRCDIPYEFGTTYMKAKKYAQAVQMFERKIACDTSSGYQFASHLNMAMALMQIKEFKAAKEHILKAIQFRPDNVQAWLTLAQDCGQLDQIDDEIAAYKKVIELATAASENGDASKFVSYLSESYRMVGVRYLIAATKLQRDGNKEAEMKKMYGSASDFLKKALQYDMKDCQVLLWIAQANQNNGNKEEAKKYYCKLLQQCPNAKEAKDAQAGMDALGMKCGE